MTKTYAPFDAAAYLDNDDVIAEYLTAAAEDPNPEVFLAALGDVAKARGMAQIARDAGLGRESLYKALSSGAHPAMRPLRPSCMRSALSSRSSRPRTIACCDRCRCLQTVTASSSSERSRGSKT